MKINWKVVSKSSGYKSLKASVNRDKQKHNNDKLRYERMFRAAINLCIRVSEQTNLPLTYVLNIAEDARSYWYPNFYQHHEMVKLFKKYGYTGKQRKTPTTQRGRVRAIKSYYQKHSHWYVGNVKSQQLQKQRVVEELSQTDKNRWSPRKRRGERIMREYRAKKSL